MKRISQGGLMGWPLLFQFTGCLWLSPFLAAQSSAWQPVPGPLMTRWTKQVRPHNMWKEYPRPQMVRQEWQNLNGLWEYAIRPKAEAAPATFDGRILVPFAAKSALSGVKKELGHTTDSGITECLASPPNGPASVSGCTSAQWIGRQSWS